MFRNEIAVVVAALALTACSFEEGFEPGEVDESLQHRLGSRETLELEPSSLIGCGAGGTLAAGREIEEGPGLVVWAASLPGAEVNTVHVTAERDADAFTLLGLPEGLADGGAAANGDQALVVLADPYTFPAEELLAQVEERRPGLPVLGGLASAAYGGGPVLQPTPNDPGWQCLFGWVKGQPNRQACIDGTF